MSIETLRLILIPFTPGQLLALVQGSPIFESLIGFPAERGLREFVTSDDVSPAWLATLRASESADPWAYGFAVLCRQSNSIIGSAGFKGRPDDDGMVEVAYGIVPGFRGRGYATEVVRALVEFAFNTAGVRLIRAHTLPNINPSTRVLTKCGFDHVGEVIDPHDGMVWRWERTPLAIM